MDSHKKQYVLFVISDNPINIQIDPTEVRHLVNTEFDLGSNAGGGWLANATIPSDCCRDSHPCTYQATGETISEVILNWLRKLNRTFSYWPPYRQREDTAYKEEKARRAASRS
jgi:hypothetical protein